MGMEERVEQLEKRVTELERQATVQPLPTKKHTCVNCKEKKATLQLNDTDWICETCAQYMSDMAPRD